MMKTALCTGITGQDGAYLAKLLLEKGYQVYGGFRRISTPNFWRLDEMGIKDKIKLIELDITDQGNISRVLREVSPDEVYNLAAQSYVGASFEQPITTAEITALGALNLLEAIRIVNPKIKFFQASTSELFGKVQESPQSEKTPFYPRSPYGISKLFAHWTTINYRESYDIFGCCGILSNHESPLRGKEFVTRKITDSVAKVYLGKQEIIELGNLNAERDWGFAKEYVEGIYLMMQMDVPDNYVLATGRKQSVRDFVNCAFKAIDIEIEWKGKNENETGINRKTGKTIVKVNPGFYRPSEVESLIGDASKAKRELGWQAKTTLEELCRMMVEADIRRNKNGISF